jgi:hypothetical protein
MDNLFLHWLQKLESKPDVKVTVQVADDYYAYEGEILVIENNLCLMREKNKSYLFRVADVVEICGKNDLFKSRPKKKCGKNPFWKWLYSLKNKGEVEIHTQVSGVGYRYNGIVIRLEENLCVLRERYTDYLFRIDDVIEINVDSSSHLFSLRSEVEIEEIKE